MKDVCAQAMAGESAPRGKRAWLVHARKIALILLLVALAGCSSTSKKKSDPLVPGAPPAPGPTSGPAKFPSGGDPLVSTSPTRSGQAIAGRVLDEYGRLAPNSFVRVVAVGE